MATVRTFSVTFGAVAITFQAQHVKCGMEIYNKCQPTYTLHISLLSVSEKLQNYRGYATLSLQRIILSYTASVLSNNIYYLNMCFSSVYELLYGNTCFLVVVYLTF
jgi:hypothetical protein